MPKTAQLVEGRARITKEKLVDQHVYFVGSLFRVVI